MIQKLGVRGYCPRRAADRCPHKSGFPERVQQSHGQKTKVVERWSNSWGQPIFVAALGCGAFNQRGLLITAALFTQKNLRIGDITGQKELYFGNSELEATGRGLSQISLILTGDTQNVEGPEAEMPNEMALSLQLRCVSCGHELGDIQSPPKQSINCPGCDYGMSWTGEFWDACVDRSFPRDFARQWILWDQGKLGDPKLIYGKDPTYFFRELLRYTSLTETQLESMKILEVGFGHGRTLAQLQKRCPAAYGLDLSTPLNSAQLRPGSAIFGNLLNMPFVPHQFDLVICRGVIHVTPDPHKSFDSVAAQVRDGGMLYVGGLYEPGGRRSLLLRKIFPHVWNYPEIVRRGIASFFGAVRAAMEAFHSRKLDLRLFRSHYRHFELIIFDAIAPRWTTLLTEDNVLPWFKALGFTARRVGIGDYLGVKTISRSSN